MSAAHQPLAGVGSVKVKLGALVGSSVVVAAVVATVGRTGGVPVWLSVPVTILVSLAVTQLLAVGMTSPLRQMTDAARRMATGDYAVRVDDSSRDEIGELARTFNAMARDLADVDRQRRELVANVSHELRTPLAGLCALLENLLDGVAAPGPQALADALAEAERLAGLVEDLLDLARVDAGKVALHPEPVALAPLVTAAVADLQVLGRAVSYRVDVQPTDLVVLADPARLRQLVVNLLDNASRHSPHDATVTITARRDGARFHLEVHDQGPGIAAADRDRVFERFGTLSGTGGAGGTGLGLAISRWVAELHGGRIRFVDPEPGDVGARVRVDLPVNPPDRPAHREEDPVPFPQPPTGSTAVPTPPPAPTPAAPVAVRPRPLLDDLFGGFWPDREAPARRDLLLAALATGVLAGVVLPFRELGLGTFAVVAAAGGTVMAASRHRRDRFTLATAALCALLAATTLVRDADWIVALSLLAGAALCLAGVTRARSFSAHFLTGLAWPLAALRGLPWLARTLARLPGLGQGAALARTLLWSVLGLLVFGALFASADALVGQWADALLPDLSLDSFALRAFLTVAVGGTVLAAAYVALNPPRVDRDASPPPPVARRYEWLAPVLVVVAVFMAFLAAQASVVFGGHDYVRRTTGLTYAEYAHQGFGQLTVATALTLLVVWAAARKAPRASAADRAWLRGSLGLLCVLTLVVLASAANRMNLYQEAYGFTRLRVLVDAFDGWLALVFLAVLVSGVALRGAWLPRFALLSGAVVLLGVAALNPDAWIAEQNLDRFAETGRVDWGYLRGLSDDAVPVLAKLPEDLRTCALRGRSAASGDWLEWNLGRARAADVLGSTVIATPGPARCRTG